MIGPRRGPRLLRWLVALIDDALPMPSEQRTGDDWAPRADEATRRQRLRLKLQMLEKRGKGGYR